MKATKKKYGQNYPLADKVKKSERDERSGQAEKLKGSKVTRPVRRV